MSALTQCIPSLTASVLQLERAIRLRSAVGAELPVLAVINLTAGHLSGERGQVEFAQLINEGLRQAGAAAPSGLPAGVGTGTLRVVGSPYESAADTAFAEFLTDSRRVGAGVLLSCGGDGTHRHLLSLLHSAGNAAEGVELLRISAGTGNDGADVRDAAELATFLHGASSAGSAASGMGSRVEVLKLSSASGRQWVCGNIASLGLDAYVAGVNNRLRGRLPGRSYRLIADIAVLFYEQRFGISEMRIHFPQTPDDDVAGRYAITVIGVSGHRVYGGHLPVLPGPENCCAIATGNLRRKLRTKAMLYEGTHPSDPGTVFRSGRIIELHYSGRIPMQVDGDDFWMEPQDFPLRLEVLTTAVRVWGSPGRDGDGGAPG